MKIELSLASVIIIILIIVVIIIDASISTRSAIVISDNETVRTISDISSPYHPSLIEFDTEAKETEPVVTEPIIDCPIFEYDIYDIVCLAKLIQGEGGGLSKLEKSAIVWCALNYLDSGEWEDNIVDVVKSPNRFTGYSKNNRVTDENLEVAMDVLDRYAREVSGEQDVGRTLPKDYICFRGFKWYDKAVEFGLTKPTYSHNWFFTVGEYHKDKYERDYWDWSLPNPYG